MDGKDVKCPKCGTVNRSLFLEETEGQYECERCGHRGSVPVQAVRRLAAYEKGLKGPRGEGDSRDGRLTPLRA